MIRRPWRVLSMLLLFGAAPTVQAQEFIRQSFFVAPFLGSDNATIDAARKISTAVRSQMERSASKRTLDVIDGDALYYALKRSGYDEDMPLHTLEIRVLARELRTDEILVAEVSKEKDEFVVRASIVLARDWRLREPLPVVRAARVDAAAQALTKSVLAARAEMAPIRRCENARREGNFVAAAAAAAEAIRAYPGALSRTCLLVSLTYQPTPADSLRRVAEAVLAVDSLSVLAAVERAEALMTLSKNTEAIAAWQRAIRIAPDSVDIGLRAIDAMLRLREYEAALTQSRALTKHHATTLSFPRLTFRTLIALARWQDAARLGDSLTAADTAFAHDSTYTVRHIEALRLSGDTLGALASSTGAIRLHPGDARLYLQYLQLITGEAGTALARGLARFPESPELYVLQMREARASGHRREAIAAAEAALRRDPTLLPMYLQVADLWLDELQPDSAFDALARAPREGAAASAALRSYALSRGTKLLRSAADTSLTLVRASVPFLALADSIESGDDSRAMRTAASLQLSRGELIAAGRNRTCPEARRADDALGDGRVALERGINAAASGAQLRESYDAMRAAVDVALRTYCKSPGAP